MGVRRRLLVAAGVPVVAVAVLAVEVELARRGENLGDVQLDHADAGATTAVWIGDSTAFGVGATSGPRTVASRVATARGERVVMFGVSGATLAEVVDEQLPLVEEAAPARVYVSVGANDVTHLTGRGEFRRDYRSLLSGLPEGAEVVVLGVPDMGAPPRLAQPLRALAGWRGRQLDAVVRHEVRRRPGMTYVDIRGRTGPPFRHDPARYFADDRYHPSDDGYRLWAEAVLASVPR